MEFKLNDYHRNTSDEELLNDLKNVAAKLCRNNLTKEDYNKLGKYSSGTLERRFGKWNIALEKAGLDLSRATNISDIDLFKNIEQVWISVGRQPKYDEIKRPISKYSTTPYDKRFGSWRKALEAFVDWINSDDDQNQEKNEVEEVTPEINQEEIVFKHKTKRIPSERLKVQVLMRDGNKCRLCGITLTGDNIHFDHIVPWSKGGETELDNLQILCAPHNLAKGNVEY